MLSQEQEAVNTLLIDDKAMTTNTLLFKLEYKGHSAYLLPTCHYFPYARLHEDIKGIISMTDMLISETKEPFFGLDEFFIPDPKKLYNQLQEQTKNKLHIMLSNLCKAYDIHKTLSTEDIPLWCFAFLTLKFYWPELGIDFELHHIFKSTKKTILGLDSDDFSEEDPNEEDAKNCFRDKSDEDMINTIEYYLNYQHISGLRGMFDEYINCETNNDFSFDPTNQENHDCVTYRNSVWMPKIIDILEHYPSTALFAVGMTHLFGPTGLLNMLKASDVCISRMGVDGQFHPYYVDLPTTCSVKQIRAEQKNYKFLKSQILEPQKASLPSWLYQMTCNRPKKERNSLAVANTPAQEGISTTRAISP